MLVFCTMQDASMGTVSPITGHGLHAAAAAGLRSSTV
jgi:hypothetical protein